MRLDTIFELVVIRMQAQRAFEADVSFLGLKQRHVNQPDSGRAEGLIGTQHVIAVQLTDLSESFVVPVAYKFTALRVVTGFMTQGEKTGDARMGFLKPAHGAFYFGGVFQPSFGNMIGSVLYRF